MLNKIITLGDKVDIVKKDYDFSGDTENIIYKSKILEINNNNQLKILAPIKGGKVISLEENKSYYLCFYTKKGLYRCKAKILNMDKNEHQYTISVSLLTKLDRFQRRQFFRLNCIMNIMYKDITKKTRKEWSEGIVLDLSGGGLRFTTTEKLDISQAIICKLQLRFNKTKIINIQIEGIVLTKDRIGDELKFEYRVEFQNISADNRELLIKYIFEQQRRQRKREKGMI